jgi:MATE family multidrug resistance protein
VVEFGILFIFKSHLLQIFTNSQELIEESDKVMNIMLVVSSMDMIQGSLSGVIKALNLQKFAMWINCVTYYFIVVPLAVYFTFFYKNIPDR